MEFMNIYDAKLAGPLKISQVRPLLHSMRLVLLPISGQRLKIRSAIPNSKISQPGMSSFPVDSFII